MKLQHPERLAEDIEAGLGELHWLYDRIDPSMRLRTEGACGVASIAIAQHLRDQGHDVKLVISSPQLWIDPEMQHILPVVLGQREELIIDASFSQFLSYAGMSEGYIKHGGENLYPDIKIAHIYDGNTEDLVSLMTNRALLSLESYNAPDRWFRRLDMEGMDAGDIRAIYSAIWDPANFDRYRPSGATIEAGQKLASFILPEHVTLVD